MIKSVGGVAVKTKHRLSYHCGTVVLELDLPDGIVNPRRCGAGQVGEDALQHYQFNTNVAKHYFCSICGIYPHHQRRSFPNQYGYNVGCLEGINPFDLEPVPLNDGVYHPADRAQ